MCVFNFFFWKSWLAGEELYLLQKKKLKVEFCGCSDTRRAFSRACIAKCAYHKPPLCGGWAALPRCAQVAPPRGAVLAAARRRGAEPLPGGVVLLGLKRYAGGPAYKKNGISFSFQRSSVCASRMPLDLLVVIALGKHRQVLDVRPPFQEKFEARMRWILSSKMAS